MPFGFFLWVLFVIILYRICPNINLRNYKTARVGPVPKKAPVKCALCELSVVNKHVLKRHVSLQWYLSDAYLLAPFPTPFPKHHQLSQYWHLLQTLSQFLLKTMLLF
jgi:hypothetical protein